tara:strand:+ start:7730 stop:8803 length:1074 start_codon:yes stop_codon:yes gene_type:complete
MKVVFRVDASIAMGSGHVMRCLTLAEELRQRGAVCSFICREHSGNLISVIRNKGFEVFNLFLQEEPSNVHGVLSHASWLGASQKQDSFECKRVLAELIPDWLVVDHYALDEVWEEALRKHCRRIMVIDDLADRKHNCDLLLDQTFGRDYTDYEPLTTADCVVLCGSDYALLRAEFSLWRDGALKRRKQGHCNRILVNLGGVDKDNYTGAVLAVLSKSGLPKDCVITIVMGITAPWLKDVSVSADSLPWGTEVKVGVNNMAELMAESDLAIGASGATSWERCCVGLPSIVIKIASNQNLIAENLHRKRAVVLTDLDALPETLRDFVSNLSSNLKAMSSAAGNICDGKGVARVVERLYE